MAMATLQLGTEYVGIRKLLDEKRAIRGRRLARLSLPGFISNAAAVPFALFISPAQAATAEDVAKSFTRAQEFTNQAITVTGTAYETVTELCRQLFTRAKPAVDIAVPLLQKTADTALKAAIPIATEAAAQAGKALESVGVNTSVFQTAKTAANVAGEAAKLSLDIAQPVASTSLKALVSSDPLLLAGEVGALILLYLVAPRIFSTVGYAVRGYKGNLTSPKALDLLTQQNYTVIDVRTEKDKSKSGLPDLPNNTKNKYIALQIEEFPDKLKSQLRNARTVEAEVTAIKISALKRINKNSNIILLDSRGDIAKTVAKFLTRLGVKNTWIIDDGFDGRKGWIQNRLGTQSYNSSKPAFAQLISPTRIIPFKSPSPSSSTSSKVVDLAPSRRLLSE